MTIPTGLCGHDRAAGNPTPSKNGIYKRIVCPRCHSVSTELVEMRTIDTKQFPPAGALEITLWCYPCTNYRCTVVPIVQHTTRPGPDHECPFCVDGRA